MAKSKTHDDEAARRARWFGSRLRELRAARGVTQAALAKTTGMSQSTIAEYEAAPGANRPSWETVLRLSIGLGVPVSEFAVPPVVAEKIPNPD